MNFSWPNIGILALIGGATVILSIVSYQFSSAASNQILSIAADDIRSGAKIQAHDLSNVLASKISAISNNLKTASERSVFKDNSQLENAKLTLTGLQDASKDLTDVYFWLDQDGKLVWASSISADQSNVGADRSYREYFTGPRDSGDVYFTTAIVSTDGIPRIHVATPIFDSGGQFKGVIGAGIRLQVLGQFLENQISPEFSGQVGMMDRNGVVLYSNNVEMIGTNIFDDKIQSQIPDDLKGTFNDFLHRSLSGGSGAEDLSYQGKTGSLAYQTATINGKDFAVIYVTAEHVFASDVLAIVGQQQVFAWIMIGVVTAIAAGLAIIVLSWNGQLKIVVTEKTKGLESANVDLRQKSAELEKALDEVEESNMQLEKANEKILAHDQMQTEFVNIAAHELRTPIQPLLSAAEILEEELQQGAENMKISKEEIEMIIRNAKRLARLSSDLLEVSRIESGTLNLKLETFDLNERIKTEIIDSNHVDPNLKIDFRPSVESIIIEADKSRISEVISNLLANAIKFTKEGTITLTTAIVNGNVEVKVRDTGTGIDDEMIPRLFTRFSSRSDAGTGLGLFISKSIVEAHGGKIWGENNPNSDGATFVFSLPIILKEQKFAK